MNMNHERFKTLTCDEAAEISGAGRGILCLLAGAAIGLSIVSWNALAIVASVAAADQAC
jgi:hypothetical protein